MLFFSNAVGNRADFTADEKESVVVLVELVVAEVLAVVTIVVELVAVMLVLAVAAKTVLLVVVVANPRW